LVIKLSEKESLIKSFLLFFVVIELFLVFIFYNYYRIEVEHTQENITMQMKNYSFFLDSDKYDIDIVPYKQEYKYYELYMDDNYLYILAPLPVKSDELLKVYYPKKQYNRLLQKLRDKIYMQFIFLSFVSMLISMLFAMYVLKPLRESINLLEVFIKDIIHDLNTPITSILINLQMVEKQSEEIESIKQSAKTISMLHKNLTNYIQNTSFENKDFDLVDLVDEQIKFFRPLYPHLRWEIDLDKGLKVYSDYNALSRVVYNLLSNACKYNTSKGYIKIYIKHNNLCIENDSYGIENPHRVFDRFYKESERGLGIGLHIVDRLCHDLHIKKHLNVDKNIVLFCLEFR